MARKIKITENQLEKIVKNIISEAGNPNLTAQTAGVSQDAVTIYNMLRSAAGGAGTDNYGLVTAIKKITSQQLYKDITTWNNKRWGSSNADFVAYTLNDELNPEDSLDKATLDDIAGHLKQFGITVTDDGTNDSVKVTISAAPDEKQGGNDQTIGTPTDIETWIKNSGMECVKLGSPSGPHTPPSGKGGSFIQFSLGNNVYVAIYQDRNARYYNYANTNELDKRVTAQCNSAGMIELLEAGQVIRTFDPKNPEGGASKGGQVKPKAPLKQATITQDIKDKKGFVYFGMSGPVVTEIQNLINQGSTNTDQINVTNTFDSETLRKVKEIQSNMGVKADGIIGPLTYEKLKQRVRFNVKDTNVSQVKPAEISKPTGTVQVPQPGPLPIQEQVNKFKKILNYGKKGVK